MQRRVIWLNGSFGVGKSAVAAELARILPGAILFDPEQLGAVLRQSLPPELRLGDYQDDPVWREATREVVAALVRRHERPVIVPMTLVVPAYVDEIIGGLRRAGIHVGHIWLHATRSTIEDRLRRRADTTGWARAQLDRCGSPPAHEPVPSVVQTEGRSVTEVAAAIAGLGQ